MCDLCRLIWYALVGRFRSRAPLEAENMALRHQLNILRHSSPKKLALSNIEEGRPAPSQYRRSRSASTAEMSGLTALSPSRQRREPLKHGQDRRGAERSCPMLVC